MTAALWLLYGLGAIQATALTALLLRVDRRARGIRHRSALILLGGALWPVWAAGGGLLFAGWVVSYPWRQRLRVANGGKP
jgi:hypothetical protein